MPWLPFFQEGRRFTRTGLVSARIGRFASSCQRRSSSSTGFHLNPSRRMVTIQIVCARQWIRTTNISNFFLRFDILVNGGGAVTLQFQRNPYRPEMRTVWAAWNRIVVLDSVVLRLVDSGDSLASGPGDRKQSNENCPNVASTRWK